MFARRGLEKQFQEIANHELPEVAIFANAAKVTPLISQKVAPEGYYDDMGLKLVTPTKKIIRQPVEKKKKPLKEIEPIYSPLVAKSTTKNRKIDRSIEDSGNYYYSSTRSESRALAAAISSSPPREVSPPPTPTPKPKKTKTPKLASNTPSTPSTKAAQTLPPNMPAYPTHIPPTQPYYMPPYYPPPMYAYASPYPQYPSPYASHPYPYAQYPTYSIPLPAKESANVPKMVQSAYTNPYTYYSYPSSSSLSTSLGISNAVPNTTSISPSEPTATSESTEAIETAPSNTSQPP